MSLLSKSLFIFFLITIGYWLVTDTASAQVPACDLCGYCQGGIKPADYEQCLQCVYDYELDPSATLPISSLPKPVEDISWTVVGCVETSLGGFAQKALQFVTTIAGGVIFIILLYGSFLILTSGGDPNQLAHGKGLIKSGIIALLLILFSVFILRFVGVTLLQIPGIG